MIVMASGMVELICGGAAVSSVPIIAKSALTSASSWVQQTLPMWTMTNVHGPYIWTYVDIKTLSRATHLHRSVVIQNLEQVVGCGHLISRERHRHTIDALHREDARQARLSVIPATR